MLVKKILVPLDGSERAEQILLHARRLLHAKDASVSLVRVISDVDQLMNTHAWLEAVRDRLIARGIAATSRVVVGEPAAKIVQLAEEGEASLIALSTHGRTGIARAALGSVAEAVLRRAPVPVLVANPFALGAAEELPIRKILVALDGSTRSAQALPAAAELARVHGAELVLLHVLDLSWCHYPDVARPHELAAARTWLAKDLERLEVRGSSLIVEGTAAETIVQVAKDEHADLVVLGTHGRSGVARWWFGSTAEAVLPRCPCPLVLVRTAAAPAG